VKEGGSKGVRESGRDALTGPALMRIQRKRGIKYWCNSHSHGAGHYALNLRAKRGEEKTVVKSYATKKPASTKSGELEERVVG